MVLVMSCIDPSMAVMYLFFKLNKGLQKEFDNKVLYKTMVLLLMWVFVYVHFIIVIIEYQCYE